MNDNPHIGESFESFLSDEGICEEVTAEAVKRARRMKAEQGVGLNVQGVENREIIKR